MASRKPEKVYRIGYVTASVFAREVDTDDGKRTLRSVNVQKRYMDGEEAKYTSSFGLVRIANEEGPLTHARLHVLFEPEVQHVVQKHVRKDG